jgi:hypothetical protein
LGGFVREPLGSETFGTLANGSSFSQVVCHGLWCILGFLFFGSEESFGRRFNSGEWFLRACMRDSLLDKYRDSLSRQVCCAAESGHKLRG